MLIIRDYSIPVSYKENIEALDWREILGVGVVALKVFIYRKPTILLTSFAYTGPLRDILWAIRCRTSTLRQLLA